MDIGSKERRRNEKKEKASEKDPDYSASEICNRLVLSSLSPLIIDAVPVRGEDISFDPFVPLSAGREGGRREGGGRERWINGNDGEYRRTSSVSLTN